MKSTVQLGRIAGIEIGVHFSWFVILGLITWSLANGLLPSLNASWNETTLWALGLLLAISLFASVLVHELAHSLVAKARGFEVQGITLFLLGGVSSLKSDARHARDEFIISAVGPAASLVLAGLFWLLASIIGRDAVLIFSPQGRPLDAIETALNYLWFLNLLLAIFNLLPAFPLDGGRVLRSIIWALTGSYVKATRVAARGGQLAGLALVAFGIWQIFEGNHLGGIWSAIVGWFLQSAAGAGLRDAVRGDVPTHRDSDAHVGGLRSNSDLGIGGTDFAMRGIKVREAMQPNADTVGPEVTVFQAVYDYFLHRGFRAMPVSEGNRIIGIISLTDVKEIPRERWSYETVRAHMTPAPLKSVTSDDELSYALGLMAENSLNQAPVLEGDRLVGMLTRADIIRYLHSRREIGIQSR